MTEPRDTHPVRETKTAAAPGPEVKPEVIQDLDMPDDEDIVGGTGRTDTGPFCCTPVSLVTV